MANNDPAADIDWTKTPSMGITEFDDMLFEEVDIGDLFWLNTRPGDTNQVYRKMTERAGLNLRTQTLLNMEPRTKVFQKT
mgnify:CR=1 FL=1